MLLCVGCVCMLSGQLAHGFALVAAALRMVWRNGALRCSAAAAEELRKQTSGQPSCQLAQQLAQMPQGAAVDSAVRLPGALPLRLVGDIDPAWVPIVHFAPEGFWRFRSFGLTTPEAP